MDGEKDYTVGQTARVFGVDSWHVRRLFERNLLPAPRRFGRHRVIPASDLPRVEAALRAAGYLRPEAARA
jgi:excisionase family DNA binding protein